MKTIVAQRVLDDRGQSVAETKAVFLDGSGVLSYRADAVTALDPATLALSGAIADAAPADGGYPYQGKAYDSSPLGRVVARGIPGAEFAIVPGAHAPHDQEIEYGANAPTGPLPAGVFTAQTTTLPNPATGPIAAPVSQVTLSEPSLGTVAQIDAADAKSGSLSLTVYDELGNAVALHPPAYFDPPSGDPADWAHTFELTPLSDVAAWTAPDTGKLRCIYDLAGRLRFAQTPAGAAAGWFAYRRYDVLGRTVEVGTLNGDWDGAALQQRADTDPGWPAADTWQRRYGYDGDGSVPHALGRPTASWANQPGGAIVETYTYDACGGLADATLAVPGYDGATRAVSFEANAVGDIVRTAFSSTLGDFVPVPIVTTYDALGRVGEVALDGGATLARFTYNADGTPATETLDPDGAAPVTRTLAYLSPGWPATITDSDPKGLIFGQELTYTSGGYQGSGWFDGRIASASFRYGWQDAPEDLGWAYLYDASGALITAKSTLGGELDVGVTTPFVYDPNGNATAGSVGNDALSYEYAPGTNQATTLTGLGGARGYGYDAAGRVKSVTSPAGDVAFGYDGMRLAPATASWSGGTIAYAYGPRRTRAMRVAHDTTGAELARKLYVRDLHGRLLAERVLAGGAETVVQHVAGPFGDVALLVHAGGATTTYFPLRDVQGSTRVVLGPGNAVVAAYDYLPSGAVARSSGRLADFFTFLYTGQELEPELGLYDYRARFYDPALGRFLAPDPDAELFGTYTYAEDDPVLYTDPTGGFGFLAILGLVAQVLLDVAIEAASLGAATPAEAPLIIGEVATDTAELGVAAVETATSAARAATVATRAAETAKTATEVAETGDQVVAEGAQAGRETVTIAAKGAHMSDDIPPGYVSLGTHGTDSASAESIEKVGLIEKGGENFGGYSQLGPGLYAAPDRSAAEYFARNAVLRNGGVSAGFDVLLPDTATRLEVEEADEMGEETMQEYLQSPRWKKLSGYDVNSGEIRGLEMWRQNKINARAFPKVKLIRRWSSTLAAPRYARTVSAPVSVRMPVVRAPQVVSRFIKLFL